MGYLGIMTHVRQRGKEGMEMYYDRQGRAMTRDEWVALMSEQGFQARRVAEDTLPNGRWVSTVWLGMDLAFGDGPPLIFETMVFPDQDNMSGLDCERYSTEAQAREGHKRLCAEWGEKL